MVKFALQTRAPRFILGLLAMHGLTDLCSPVEIFLPYLCALLLPAPDVLVTAAFFASSVAHFGADLCSFSGSVALHGALAATARVWGPNAAFDAMVAYMTFIHVPVHFKRVLSSDRRASCAISALAVVGGLVGGPVGFPIAAGRARLCIGHREQRLVVAHVLSSINFLQS
jgi:hypothetical protein